MQVFQSLRDPICQGVGSASPRLDMERANALWPMCRSHTATYRFKAGMSKLRALTGWFEHPMETVTCLASINAVSTFILCGGGKF